MSGLVDEVVSCALIPVRVSSFCLLSAVCAAGVESEDLNQAVERDFASKKILIEELFLTISAFSELHLLGTTEFDTSSEQFFIFRNKNATYFLVNF